ncbi:MAG TPA: mechanosensitive ion channel family protein [Candidatus Saccharimonadales bacterium]|nr:mechanosensitive ion channel family protein [Candidatus Saccharimonadales bacterium]
MPDLSRLSIGPLPDWAATTLQVLLIVVVATLGFVFARGFVHGIFRTLLDREAREGTAQELSAAELQKRMTTLDSLGVNLLQFFIVVIAALMILGRLGLDIGPAVAGLGIAGIAVGFGAQSLVKDYFNGILILIENQYGKGDVVRLAGVEGTVEDLTLRRTTLRDFDGNLHTVPNSAIVVASNLTRGWARINEELQVPTADLVDQATDAVDRVGVKMAADPIWHRRLLEPPHVERIDALGPSGITLKIGGRVGAAYRWTAVGELRRRLLVAFRDENIPLVPSGSVPTATTATATTTGTATGAPAGPAPNQDELAERTD